MAEYDMVSGGPTAWVLVWTGKMCNNPRIMTLKELYALSNFEDHGPGDEEPLWFCPNPVLRYSELCDTVLRNRLQQVLQSNVRNLLDDHFGDPHSLVDDLAHAMHERLEKADVLRIVAKKVRSKLLRHTACVWVVAVFEELSLMRRFVDAGAPAGQWCVIVDGTRDSMVYVGYPAAMRDELCGRFRLAEFGDVAPGVPVFSPDSEYPKFVVTPEAVHTAEVGSIFLAEEGV